MQIESLVASYLVAFGHPARVTSYQSVGIPGHGTLLAIASAVLLGTLLWIWIAFSSLAPV